ncbi:MAG: Organic solvent tolerance protein, partial [Candidatus Solibacter sp.]|nr:Organic solvent tolerance protein [Candidatus Solibacter sp.]
MLGLILALNAPAQVNPVPPQEPPPAVPPKSLSVGQWNFTAPVQKMDGPIYTLHGNPAEVESATMVFRADDIVFNSETGDVKADGHVFFHDFLKNQKIWASHLTYNTEEETGKFYDVTGETSPRIIAKPGILTTNNPFHFEGEWAERIGMKYILHNGFITNCKMPKPWWRLRGKTFDIIPGERAVSRNSTFIIRKLPIFYTPFFYHSLEREPRKSGLLMPFIGHSSGRGWMVHGGYFWAINRSYDVSYLCQFYTSGSFVHHVDFRGKPGARTDYDAIFYGVQDGGLPGNNDPNQKFSGYSLLIVGKSDLGKGWTSRGSLNYISSFRFRQNWSQSYTDLTGSEIHSVGFINKNWSSYTVNVIFARLQNFQSSEILVTDPVTNTTHFVANAVTIRKLPEIEFTSRDRRITRNLPVYFSYESSAGLLYRSEPVFNGNTLIDNFQTSQFMNRSSVSPRVTGAFDFAGIHLVPSFGIQEMYYGEAQSPYLDRYRTVGTNIVRSARDFSVDLIFPSLARVFQKKTMFGDKLKHVIEPRATYRNVTGVGTDFLRFIRFDENDLTSNTNEILLSLTNRIYAKRGNSVEEIFSWELYQKRYFDPTFGGALIQGQRNVIASSADLTAYAFLVGPRSTSPVVSSLRMSPVGNFSLRWQTDYDPRAHGIVDSSLTMDYHLKDYFLSIGHSSVHTDPAITAPANQFRIRGGFGDPNHKGINAGAEAIYDARQGSIQYVTGLVTYNTNCCGFSVQYRHVNLPGVTTNKDQFRFAFAIA